MAKPICTATALPTDPTTLTVEAVTACSRTGAAAITMSVYVRHTYDAEKRQAMAARLHQRRDLAPCPAIEAGELGLLRRLDR